MDELNFNKISFYADGADLNEIRNLRLNPLVKGFTTNPTLMRLAGIKNYLEFARDAIQVVTPLPISLEVFGDNETEMIRQAMILHNLGENVFVKIPVTNSMGLSSSKVLTTLNAEGVKLNITAVFTIEQVIEVSNSLANDTPAIISVFAGRIADAGVDPVQIMQMAKSYIKNQANQKLLWASPREILNVIQAQKCECDIITMTPDLWKKIPLLGKDLNHYSLETVQMFLRDAQTSMFSI
jgi:transaldolase